MRASISKINTFKRCPRKYYYAYVDKIARKVKSLAPARGTIIHACLEEYYAGRTWTKPIEDLKLDLSNVFEEERELWATLPTDIYTIVSNYLASYRQVDSKIKTIETELQFEVPLTKKHVFEGIIDWIFVDEQGLWVADHKTVKQIPDAELNFTDAQTTLYFKVAELMKMEPLGTVFNYIKTKTPETPVLLKNGNMSRANIDTDVFTYMKAVKAAGLDPADYEDMAQKLADKTYYKRQRIPRPDSLVKGLVEDTIQTMGIMDSFDKASKHNHYRCVSKQCAWDCEYAPLCFAELTGRDVTALIDDQYEERGRKMHDGKEVAGVN